MDKVLEFIQADERLKGLRLVESPVSPEEEAIHHGHTSHSPLGAGEDAPFRWDHVRVKLKKEVSLCAESIFPSLYYLMHCSNLALLIPESSTSQRNLF